MYTLIHSCARSHTHTHTHTHTHMHTHINIQTFVDFLYRYGVLASFIVFYQTDVLPFSMKISRMTSILQASLYQQYAFPASHALLTETLTALKH